MFDVSSLHRPSPQLAAGNKEDLGRVLLGGKTMFFGGDPFEHFGGGMGGRAVHRGEVDNEEFYNILGVSKDASDSDIKKVR